jgi:hypothetical protein
MDCWFGLPEHDEGKIEKKKISSPSLVFEYV